MKRSYPLILSLVAALVAGCRSHTNPIAAPEIVPPGSFVHSWSVTPEFDDVHHFYLTGDLLFVHGDDNYVAAYDLNGGIKFRKSIGNKIESVGEPMVQPDQIVFPLSSSLEVYKRDGYHLKSIPLAQPLRSPGVVSGETVYIGTDSAQGGRIAAISLDRDYDITRWTRLAGGVVRQQPALHDNVIYFGTDTGQVVALTTDPVLLWPRSPEMQDRIFHTQGQIQAAVKADETGVYVPSTDTKLYCLDAITGKIRWEWLAQAPVIHSPQLTSDSAYIYMDNRGLVALNKKSESRYATPRWVLAEGRSVLSEDAKLVYILTTSGKIAAVNKTTGIVQYASQRSDFVEGVMHINPKDSTIYVLTKSGFIMALTPVNRAGVVGSLVMADGELLDVVR